MIVCPKCGVEWPVLCEQAVAIEAMNACMRCSYFSWSEDTHVSVIEAIQDHFRIDYTKFIKLLRKEVCGATVAVAKDRANPYAESHIVGPRSAGVRRGR